MGEVNIDFSQVKADLHESLDDRLADFAELIEDDARARAPVRKTTPGRRRGRLSAFSPEGRNQTYSFGRVTLSGEEITRAAQRLGVPLFLSMSSRRKAGKGPLLIRERRPGRRIKRENTLVRRKVFKQLRQYSDSKYKESIRRIAGGTGRVTKAGRDEEDVRPGRLRRSIYSERSGGSSMQIIYTIRAGAPYARYVEFPTSRTAAQPFLLPALKNARSRLKPWLKGRKR